MKTFRIVLFIFIFVISVPFLTFLSASETLLNDLPETIQNYLNEHYPNVKIDAVTIKVGKDGQKFYHVKLDDETNKRDLIFNQEGELITEVEENLRDYPSDTNKKSEKELILVIPDIKSPKFQKNLTEIEKELEQFGLKLGKKLLRELYPNLDENDTNLFRFKIDKDARVKVYSLKDFSDLFSQNHLEKLFKDLKISIDGNEIRIKIHSEKDSENKEDYEKQESYPDRSDKRNQQNVEKKVIIIREQNSSDGFGDIGEDYQLKKKKDKR